MPTPGHTAQPVPPKDVLDAVFELSAALQKHGMYPSGHPALERLSAAIHGRLVVLFEQRGDLAIGVGRQQLMLDGIATDAANPVLRRLAELLHDHQLGAVTFSKGVQPSELSDALRALSAPPQRGPLGLLPPDVRPAWPHVALHPLKFDNLAIAPEGESGGESSSPGFEGADLWLGLAQAALTLDAAADRTVASEPDAPARLAKAIDARVGSSAYEHAVAGYLRQITHVLRTSPEGGTEALRDRTSTLISALQPETLRQLVRTSRVASGSNDFVQSAVRGLRIDAVLEILKSTADVSGENISHGLVRMLTKLAAHARGRAPSVREAAQEQLREQVTRLLADWKLADPNPESYGRLLQQLATTGQETIAPAATSHGVEGPLRVVQMALELGEFGPLALKAVDLHLANGGIADLVALLEQPPPGAESALVQLRAQLIRPDALRRLLEADPVDIEALDALMPTMSALDCKPLLDSLASSENRVTRRRLLDRLADAPQDLSPLILSMLSDPRWHVRRNLFVLLDRRRPLPDGFSPRPWMVDSDWRVRTEALRLALTMPDERREAIVASLKDAHPRVISLGLAALVEEPEGTYAPQVAALVSKSELPDDVRTSALRHLCRGASPAALRTLIGLVDGGRSFIGRQKLAPPTPISLLALGILARQYAGRNEVEPLLNAARRSASPDVRAAVKAAP